MRILANSQSDVIVFDHLDPEATAMALALYSRDPQSIRVHLNKVAEVGSDKFMSQYYVGYGHASIGDCGSTTICAEFVSMLTAKAIQDNRLYNGQEASTRYLDMIQMGVLNPLGTEHGEHIQRSWMSLYSLALEKLVPHLKEKYPMLATDKPAVYEKAIKARAFDIARSFLPAGCLTFVGWHTTLRKAWDHTRDMLYHPLEEVSGTAKRVLAELKEKYPNSFLFEIREEQEAYYKKCSQFAYSDLPLPEDFRFTNTIEIGVLRNNKDIALLIERPVKTELPEWFNRYGQIQFQFHLDFGSFRDIQRQRSCTQIMPLLTTDYGFHPWYLTSLPTDLREIAFATMDTLRDEIEKIDDMHVRQYYIAMGYQVACELTCGLPSAVYIAELRSGQAVHPTLRPVAQKMGNALKEILPEMAIHCDMNPDEWSTIRGKHDIIKKEV